MTYTWSIEAYNIEMKRIFTEDDFETRTSAVDASFDLFESNSEIDEIWVYQRYSDGEWGDKYTIRRDS